MANFKFVKSATAAVLGASVLTTAVVVPGADASAKTTYKVNKYGYLVNAKTNKKVNGYKTYKGKLYKNGKKFTGKTSYGTYYVKGKKFTGKTKYGYYYVNGKRFTGTTKYGYYYVNGKRFNGKTKYGNLYVNGKRYTGTTKYGYTYYNGKRVEGEYKEKVYTNGKLVTGLYKEKLYNKGVLETGLDLYKDKLYKDGVLNVGYALYNDKELYKDADKNVGWAINAIDGKTYFDTALANDTYTDANGVETAYEDGVEVGAKVKSVEAINAKQVKITFNKSFGDNSLATSSYSVRDLAGLANPVKDVEKVDDRTVVLTLENSYRVSTDLTVAVDGVYLKGSIKETFPKFAKVVNVNDTVAPEITDVTAKTTSTSSAQTVYVTLSEPIKAGATFRIDGTTVSASAITAVTPVAPKTTADYATTYVISGQDLAAGKSHEVEILNAEDYADNKVVSLTKTFSVTQDTSVATGAVSTIQDNKVLVKFDKAITASSLSNVKFFTYNGTTYNAAAVSAPVQADKYGKEWIFSLTGAAGFYGTNDATEDVLVKVQSGVIDTAGNPVKPFDATASFKQDTTGPVLNNVTVDKNSKGEVTKLYFAYNENLLTTAGKLQTKVSGSFADVAAASANDYFSLVNKADNKAATFTSVFGTPTDISLATDGKTVVVTVDPSTTPVKSGNYTVKALKDFVADDAAGNNSTVETAKDLSIGTVTNEVKAAPTKYAKGATMLNGDTATDNSYKVVFDQDVTADSAKNPANYTFNGKALPTDTVITVVDSKTVEFTVPAGVITKTEAAAKLVISNIKPKDASATFTTYVGTIDVTDNTAPTATGSILANGVGQIAFSEALAAAIDPADFNTLKVNGLEINPAQYTVAPAQTVDGSEVAKVTVKASVAYADGFNYLYIDVDNSTSLDLTKDIILNKAASTAGDTTDAPVAWYADGVARTTLNNVDLSKVTSVQVVTNAATTVTADAAGNKIAKGATITLK